MLFSILVANYNNGIYFEDLYHSVIQQTYNNWEVVIVDDCSNDNSLDIIRRLINGDTRFKLFLNEENRGCGFTKRRCIELAAGEICGFVDPDDAITADAVDLMVRYHSNNSVAALVHSTFYYCDEYLKPTSIYNIAKAVTVTNRFINTEGTVNHFSTFKKYFYQKTEGINPVLKRAVDQDLYLKLSETGPFEFIDKPLYYYRIHHNGISTNSNVDKAFYWYLKVIAKAEERRNVDLENEVAGYLNRTNPKNIGRNLANPRYLILQMLKSLKASPKAFFRRLFFNR